MQDIVKQIIKIMMKIFPNGIRDDFIDHNKVLRVCSAKHGNISRDFIVKIIHTHGIEIDDRFYFVSEEDTKKLTRLFDRLLKKHLLVYYTAAFKKHSEFFTGLRIFSPDTLKKILGENAPHHFYFDEFCFANELPRIDYEISKIFTAVNKSLTLQDMQKKFPYIPEEKISRILTDSRKYLQMEGAEYFPISKITFDAEEICKAK